MFSINMDKKLIIKIIFIIILILLLLWLGSWYLEKVGYIEKSIFRDWPIIGYTGYGYGDDPCYHEPNEPDPCGPS